MPKAIKTTLQINVFSFSCAAKMRLFRSQIHQSYILHGGNLLGRIGIWYAAECLLMRGRIRIVRNLSTGIGSSIGSPIADSIRHFLGSLRGCGRGAVLITSPGVNARLHRCEAGTRCGCADIVDPRDTTLATILCPRSLFTAEVTLYPRDCDYSPDDGPGKWKGPAQLIVRVNSCSIFGSDFCLL
jgi:hypothetical protein